jgi:hypothetical protein
MDSRTFWSLVYHHFSVVPWSFVVWEIVNIFAMYLVYVFTRYYYHREWLKAAPDKARDKIKELYQALAESELQQYRFYKRYGWKDRG